VDDLPSLDEELYKNLIFLKNFEGKVESLSLSFAITVQGMNLFDWTVHSFLADIFLQKWILETQLT
jgi:hypothetical protein